MTHLLDHAKPNRSFLLLKPDREIREGDTIIFQGTSSDTGEDGATVETVTEQTVKVNHVDIGSGLYKGWQLIGWEDVV